VRPVLFARWGITIQSYPAMLYVGMLAGVMAGNAAAHAAGLDADRVFLATFLLLIPALMGARLLHVVAHWRTYRRAPRRIWNRAEGGAAQYGGLLLALPLSWPLLAMLHVSFGAFWDVAIFTILVGMIFARIGCVMNGCCAGRPTESWLSCRLPNTKSVWTRRLPTQYLEAALAGLLLLGAVMLRTRMRFPGELFCVIAAGYAAGRLVLESTREQPPGGGRFTIHHGISLALLAGSLATIVFH
jgi:phosphatidylglycerol---prolipoprotein diacylglyceryl transferase